MIYAVIIHGVIKYLLLVCGGGVCVDVIFQHGASGLCHGLALSGSFDEIVKHFLRATGSDVRLIGGLFRCFWLRCCYLCSLAVLPFKADLAPFVEQYKLIDVAFLVVLDCLYGERLRAFALIQILFAKFYGDTGCGVELAAYAPIKAGTLESVGRLAFLAV